MIDAKDLRIGNWFLDSETEEKYFQAEQIRRFVGSELWVYYRSGSIKSKQVEPIPLTEEILLKCGFQRVQVPTTVEDFYITYYKNGNFVVYILDDCFEIELINNSGDQFNLFKSFKKQLHILQNVYYSLSDTELNYTP